MNGFRSSGKGLVKVRTAIWDIFKAAVEDPEAASVIIVLDALDECRASEVEFLMTVVQNQLRTEHAGDHTLKYIFTSRPYHQIVSSFGNLLEDFPNIHIPGEEESEAISQEIDLVITHRVEQLPIPHNDGMSFDVKKYLTRKLKEPTHRTYL